MVKKVVYILVICSLNAFGQTIPVGTWRNHFSFESIEHVVSDGNRTFAASQLALFLYEDEEVSVLSKLNGLNGGAITGLLYDHSQEVLLIGYENGNIDLVQEGEVINLNELAEGNFGIDRGINDFTISDNRAYAATQFGIATINLVTGEITEIFREIGPDGDILEIEEVLLSNGIFYAVTDEGIITGNQNDNLLDFNNWSLSEGSVGLKNLTAHEGHIFTSRDNTIFELNPTIQLWENRLSVAFAIVDLTSARDQLLILGEENLVALQGDSETDIPIMALEGGQSISSNQGVIYIADDQNGLIQWTNGVESLIVPNGPKSDLITHIKFQDSLFTFYTPEVQNVVAHDSTGYSVFSNGQWKNLQIDGFYSISDVTTYNNEVFLSSNSNGIYNLSQEQPVTGVFSESLVTIPSLTATINGLFAARYDHSNALYQLQDDQWIGISSTEVGSRRPVEIKTSFGGVHWLRIAAVGGNGAYAYDTQNQQSRFINSNDGLPSSVINDMAIDLDDQAWVATTSGVAFFVDATFIFDNTNGFTPVFEGRVLFEDQEVTAISVDGGNRKWMATKDGIWIFDSNVGSVEQRFTVDNSPLPSNNIKAFAYDPRTGEMFILTDRGLVSYRSPSSRGERRHQNVQIFPNPIRPQDLGPVSLTGLVSDANVKITDVQGNLIREIEALGGTAAWDLRDTSGNPVTSGVYLFLSSSNDGSETFVGKVAVVR